MSNSTRGAKVLAAVAIILIGVAAGFGYFKQSTVLSESEAKPATKIDANLLKPRADDIVIGDVNAPITIVEYMSLSCTHCAHFNQTTKNDLEKEYISKGKASLVIRHFPLNEPAIKGSVVVECAGQNGLDRKKFLKTLLEMQPKWAFTEEYLKNLKQIALVGGIDSAAFESCSTNKDLETKILASRKEGESVGVDVTPSFFINGVKFEGKPVIDDFRTALDAATKPQK